jgi:hypothetical protein
MHLTGLHDINGFQVASGSRRIEFMQELIKKMIAEAMIAQHADVNQIKK